MKTTASKNLFAYLLRDGIPVRQFADDNGFSRRRVSQWVFGKSRPNAATRVYIEFLTSGVVSYKDWLSTKELKKLVKLQHRYPSRVVSGVRNMTIVGGNTVFANPGEVPSTGVVQFDSKFWPNQSSIGLL